MTGALGVIAGTGFYSLDMLDSPDSLVVETIYGPVEAVVGRLHGRRTVFITRHGAGHTVPPHLVNYRATIQCLIDLDVSEVLAVNVVGGIGLDAGALVVVDDFIDFTKGRPVTFFDGTTPEGVVHTDMTDPYDARLRSTWIRAAEAVSIPVVADGVYGAFEGPRFETRAEIRMAQAMGVTVVGMTGVPEVTLAKERGLPYASLCLVANPAAGLGPEITIEEVMAQVAAGAEQVGRILDAAARSLAT